MKVRYIACAAGTSVDHKTNVLSLFEVMDQVAAEAFPLQIPTLGIAALFEREANEPAVHGYVTTVALDDALLASFALQLDFGATRRNRCVNTIKGLTLPRPGRVTVRLMSKSEVLAEWVFLALHSGSGRPAPPDTPRPSPGDAPRRAAPTIN